MVRGLLAGVLAPILLAVGAVRGRVVDATTGEALEGVTLTLQYFDGASRASTATSDESGAFHFPVDVPGGFRVLADQPGHSPGVFYATSGSPTALLIRLFGGAVISGHVLSEAGQPAAHVSVQLLRPLDGTASSLHARTLDGATAITETDSQGAYRLHGLGGGEYRLAAIPVLNAMPSAESGVALALAAPRALTLAAGQKLAGIDITLPQAAASSLAGQLATVPDESPVLLSLTPRSLPVMPLAQTLAGKDGSFQFNGIPAGAYNLFAAGPSSGSGGFAGFLGARPIFARATLELSAERRAEAMPLPQPGRQAAFQLLGECSPTAQLALAELEGWGARLDRTLPLSNRAPTAVEGLAPALYAATAAGLPDGCFAAPPAIVDLTAAAPPTIQIRVLKGSRLQGAVVGAKPAAEPSLVVLLWPDPRTAGVTPLIVIRTDDGWRFAAKALAPGRYRVAVLKESQWSDPQWMPEFSGAAEVELLPGGQTTLELPAVATVATGYPPH